MIDAPKSIEQARRRRYNVWGGNPNGTPYKEGRCAEQVWQQGRGALSYQCTRKAVTGPDKLFCRQHDPDAVKARQKASTDRYHAEMTRILVAQRARSAPPRLPSVS
jgi:hypothetical protein